MDSSLDCRSIAEFYGYIHRLKSLKRKGWLRHDIRDPESVASHSYSVALLALVLSYSESVDIERVLKMALIHDLAEAVSGDITPLDEGYSRKGSAEEKILEEIVSGLPQGLKREVLDLHRELEECATREARIVETADKLDMVMTAAEYRKSSGEDMGEFFDTGRWEAKFTENGKMLLKYLKSLGVSE